MPLICDVVKTVASDSRFHDDNYVARKPRREPAEHESGLRVQSRGANNEHQKREPPREILDSKFVNRHKCELILTSDQWLVNVNEYEIDRIK